MDWDAVRKRICDARGFAMRDQGLRVLSDVLMPSGAMVHVTFLSRQDRLSAHDNGAAFDELARHAAEIRSMAGVRRMLAETGFRVADNGFIWLDHVSLGDPAGGLIGVADASARAASYMMAHATIPHGQKLDRRVKDALRVHYPQGRTDFAFQGLNRQHVFDFGVEEDGALILVDAVTPEMSSVSAAIAKTLDALQAGHRVRPVFVIDEDDGWQSDALNMLSLVKAEQITIRRVTAIAESLALH